MWCIPTLTPEFIERMENILNLYAKPYDSIEPVLCFDEKSKQLLKDTRSVKNTKEKKPRRRDYEYERNGTRNIFVTVEPKGGYREVSVTKHRKKPDFAKEMKRIMELPRYENAKTFHIVLDNLNTHFEKSFTETFGKRKTKRMMKRIQFHYTPKHASWLNMAEIEIGILSRQSIKGRIPAEKDLIERMRIWQERRNSVRSTINWKFTTENARSKFQYDGSKLN